MRPPWTSFVLGREPLIRPGSSQGASKRGTDFIADFAECSNMGKICVYLVTHLLFATTTFAYQRDQWMIMLVRTKTMRQDCYGERLLRTRPYSRR